jgi:hypothetical protein
MKVRTCSARAFAPFCASFSFALAVPFALALGLGVLVPRAARADAPVALAPPAIGSSASDSAPGDGGAPSPRAAPLPDARTGPWIDRWPARPATRARACSFRHPACVHGDGAPEALVLATLGAVERAWDVATGALALPPPDADVVTGAYDVYLVDALPELTVSRALTAPGPRDPRSRVDRTSAFTLIDRHATPGCALDALVAREVLRASLFHVSPATDDASALAETSYLARLVAPCALGRVDGVDTFQAHPDRALADAWVDEDAHLGDAFGRGAALFYWWLDASYGAEPGAIVRAMWALTPTMTPLGSARWVDEPDGFDVLATSFKGALTTNSTFDDLLLEAAASRALMGPADDGTVLPEARPLGAALRPRIDWSIDWPATPRRLASPVGVSPTGAAYVAVRHAGAQAGARLRIEVAWEEHAKMRWLVLKLDPSGRERARVAVPTTERATEAQVTVVELDGTETALIVGVNAGEPTEPFDPDDGPWEPHGWTLTVAAE